MRTRETGLKPLLGLVAGREVVLLDGQLGVQDRVLVQELVVAPFAEGQDGEGDLVTGPRRVAACLTAGGEDSKTAFQMDRILTPMCLRDTPMLTAHGQV